MVKLGFPLDVDAIYGPKSEQACRELQQQRGIRVDGIVGRDTWTATFTPVA
jgi:peptidoglycan hydrolase-like protein with peptidoglycan-binding domain